MEQNAPLTGEDQATAPPQPASLPTKKPKGKRSVRPTAKPHGSRATLAPSVSASQVNDQQDDIDNNWQGQHDDAVPSTSPTSVTTSKITGSSGSTPPIGSGTDRSGQSYGLGTTQPGAVTSAPGAATNTTTDDNADDMSNDYGTIAQFDKALGITQDDGIPQAVLDTDANGGGS